MASFWEIWSVLLVYVLLLVVYGFVALIRTTKIKGIEIYWGIVFAMVLKYLCCFASGAFLFASYAPEGMDPIVYSLIYNSPYNFAILVLCMVVMSLIYPRIKRRLEALTKTRAVIKKEEIK